MKNYTSMKLSFNSFLSKTQTSNSYLKFAVQYHSTRHIKLIDCVEEVNKLLNQQKSNFPMRHESIEIFPFHK